MNFATILRNYMYDVKINITHIIAQYRSKIYNNIFIFSKLCRATDV